MSNATHSINSQGHRPQWRPLRWALTGLALLLAVPAAVLAWPSQHPAGPASASLAAVQVPSVRTCPVSLRVYPGVRGVRIHRSPSASSWTDGILYPGRTLREAWGPAGNCLPVSGGLYTACPQEAGLRTSHEWQSVAYAGRTDYVVSLCVIPAG
jgi:hypothetical protein